LNFFDDRLQNLQHENLGIILEVYFSLYPEKKNVEEVTDLLRRVAAGEQKAKLAREFVSAVRPYTNI
jgi:hypothetical protein